MTTVYEVVEANSTADTVVWFRDLQRIAYNLAQAAYRIISLLLQSWDGKIE